MNYKKSILALFGLFLILGVVSFAQMQSNSTPELLLEIDSPKNIYKLGEPINFSFKLSNNTNETFVLLDKFGTSSGFLHIKVSSGGEDFVGSDDPNWGIDDAENKTYLKPNGNIKAEGTILWNFSNQETAKFKFYKPGVYYFKAYYSAIVMGESSRIKLESEPIQITIEEPVGEDLKVWNKIKANGDFAYFIQKCNVFTPSYKPEERAKFLREVEEILTNYPNSFYADFLRQSLEKFNAHEAKMQENMRKIKSQNKDN